MGTVPQSSIGMLARFTTPAHLPISLAMCVANASGVLQTGSAPRLMNFSFTAVMPTTLHSAAFNLLMTGLGVCAGAPIPCQTVTSNPG